MPVYPWRKFITRQHFFPGTCKVSGFRYSVLQVAKEFEVSGFVINLPDGRVHLEAEGEAGEVAAFITAVGERMHGYIRKIERSERRRNALFVGFEIR